MKTARKAHSKPGRPAKVSSHVKTKAPLASDGRMKQAVAAVWVRHRVDIVALGSILAGILAAFGLWADAAGPLGNGLRVVLGALIGSARVALPIMLVFFGIAMLRGPRPSQSDGDPLDSAGARSSRFTLSPFDQEMPNGSANDAARAEAVLAVRLLIGALLTVLSVTGLLHIVVDRPDVGDLEGLADAGGVLGWTLGGLLVSGAGTWGAALVLSVVGMVGLVVLTQVSLRAWARTIEPAALRSWLVQQVRRILVVRKTPHGEEPLSEANSVSTQYASQEEDPKAEHSTSEPREVWRAPEIVASNSKRLARKSRAQSPTQASLADASESDVPASSGYGHPQTSKWRLPPLDLLNGNEAKQVGQDEASRKGLALEQALAAHDVSAKLIGMVVGPTVTRYELELASGVKVSRVTSLNKDIALALASPDVRILAPIPGRQAIGIEVPNTDRQVVTLGSILSSPEAARATHPLEVAIGRDIDGKAVVMDLSRMPHILIAGATGAGKSSCINSMLTSVLMRTTPDQVRMILVDPKMVEMAQYSNVPHLLTQPVTDPKKAANALAWACREMDRRYELLASVGVRDIDGYNHTVSQNNQEAEPLEPMSLVLVVVDELSDLMMVAPRDVEDSICRIAQKARAVGIHLVIATQRPSINVITGVIKANIPARLAFAVSSQTDSRVILDQQGAERLVGRGDMLLLSPTSTLPTRIQGAWVTESEVRAVVGNWRRQAAALGSATDDAAVTSQNTGVDIDLLSPSSKANNSDDSDDELLEQAMRLVVESQSGSTSMLQRKLRVGFARAGRLMDLLEQRGVVGPSEGSKAREVLMSSEELLSESS